MDLLLHRCSGNTFCHYSRRFERACLSYLAYKNLIPPSLSNAAVSERLSRAGLSLPRRVALFQPCPARLCHTDTSSSTTSTGSGRKRWEGGADLPLGVRRRLSELHALVGSTLSENFAGEDYSDLREAAGYYFDQGGKLIRPTVVLLMAAACNVASSPFRRPPDPASASASASVVNPSQSVVATVSEMIHTASLVHDDVIDESDERRRKPSANARWGNKQAVLAGDYVLAKATQLLCTIGDAGVIRLLAQVIEDLVNGEFMQMGARETPEGRFNHYLLRTFKKTASLFAHSCQAVARLSSETAVSAVEGAAYDYGRHFGMAFQLVDDLLDFVAKSSEVGKPVAADLKLGLATAPVLFAAKKNSELEALILRRFSRAGDVERAWRLVLESDGLEQTRRLAAYHAEQAVHFARRLPSSEFSEQLARLSEAQLKRES